MGRGRDQADPPMMVAAGVVVGPDGQQPGQFALAAGVRLDGDLGVAGHLGQPGLQGVDQGRRSPGRPATGANGCRLAKPCVRDRLHLGGGVELHGAGAERDHPAVEREVPIRQRAQIAQHRRLAVVGVEHRMGQIGRLALGTGQIAERLRARPAQAERRPDGSEVGVGGVLADRDAQTGRRRPAAGGPRRPERRPPPRRPGRAPRPARCRRTSRGPASGRPRPGRRPAQWPARGSSPRCPAGRAVRGRPRTCWPSPPAAPARCRCWRSPSPGGCAARGSAGRAGKPGVPSASLDTPTSRPGSDRSSPARTEMNPACGPP